MARSDLTPAIEIIEAVAEGVRQRGLESGHSPLSEAGLAVGSSAAAPQAPRLHLPARRDRRLQPGRLRRGAR